MIQFKRKNVETIEVTGVISDFKGLKTSFQDGLEPTGFISIVEEDGGEESFDSLMIPMSLKRCLLKDEKYTFYIIKSRMPNCLRIGAIFAIHEHGSNERIYDSAVSPILIKEVLSTAYTRRMYGAGGFFKYIPTYIALEFILSLMFGQSFLSIFGSLFVTTLFFVWPNIFAYDANKMSDCFDTLRNNGFVDAVGLTRCTAEFNVFKYKPWNKNKAA